MGQGDRSLWRGEPWATPGEPNQGKSGKCPGLRDGREVPARVRVDHEAPVSMTRVHVNSRVSGTWKPGTWKQSRSGLQPRVDDNQVHPRAKWVLRPVRDGEWWNVVERDAAPSAMAIHWKSTCRHPKGCAGGGKAGGSFEGGPHRAPVSAALTETYHWSCPKGTWLKFSAVR